jgi:hypothetical protein
MAVIIKTTSWFTKLPPDHVRIGISRGVPYQLATFLSYRPLAPGSWFKSCASPSDFKQHYFEEILAPLDPKAVVADLTLMADDGIPALLCWEAPPPNEAWCHRALVSAWLFDELGLEVCEFGHEDLGFGWKHPKLHSSLIREVALVSSGPKAKQLRGELGWRRSTNAL